MAAYSRGRQTYSLSTGPLQVARGTAAAQSLANVAGQDPSLGGPDWYANQQLMNPVGPFGAVGFNQKAQQQQFLDARKAREDMMAALGLDRLGESGGLLGQNFFQSLLGNTPGGLVGDVSQGISSGGLFGGGSGSGGDVGQPGFPDFPASSGGGGGLFGELIGSRRAEGANILADLANAGAGQRNTINQQFGNLGGTTAARLESRGLGGTDLVDAAQARVERERANALMNLEDQLLQQRVGTRMQLGEGLYGDVGDELNRQTERQKIATGFLGGLLGNALNIVNI